LSLRQLGLCRFNPNPSGGLLFGLTFWPAIICIVVESSVCAIAVRPNKSFDGRLTALSRRLRATGAPSP